MMMKKPILIALLLCVSFPALAQPVERVPLAAPNYTLQNETDPMATTPPPSSMPQSKVIIAEPPPADSSQQDAASIPPSNNGLVNLQQQNSGQYTGPSENLPPAPRAKDPLPAFNSNVSAVRPEDPRRFENKVFCTLKISFDTKPKTNPDTKIGDAVKAYLDENKNDLRRVDSQKGRKGEYSYCVVINQHRKQAKIYNDLKQIIKKTTPTNQTAVMMGSSFSPVYSDKKQRYDN